MRKYNVIKTTMNMTSGKVTTEVVNRNVVRKIAHKTVRDLNFKQHDNFTDKVVAYKMVEVESLGEVSGWEGESPPARFTLGKLGSLFSTCAYKHVFLLVAQVRVFTRFKLGMRLA